MKNKLFILGVLVAVGLGKAQNTYSTENYRISEKPLNLTIHMHYWDRDAYDENRPVHKKIAEMTNVHLKGTVPKTGTNTMELFNLMIASGDIPDIVGGTNLRDSFIKYGAEGAFIPLNNLIEEHAPNLKMYFQKNPHITSAITAADGNIYYIPYLPDGRVARGYWIRQDWMDKLGLKTPETTEELYQVLKSFREKDPNGNGMKDEIPLFFREWWELFRLAPLWGARSSGTDAYQSFYVENDQVKHGWVQPEYKEAMKNIAKWYKEGLIDPEVFTRGNKARDILFGNDVGGMTRDWFASTSMYNVTLKDKVPEINLKPIAPPINVKGQRVEENSRSALKPDGWAISVSNKNPVETIKYFDFFFENAGRKLNNFGIEGEHYDIVDGKPKFRDVVVKGSKPVNQFLYEIGAMLPIGFPQDYEYERQWTRPDALEGIDMYLKGGYILPEFLPPVLSTEEREVYDTHWPAISTYMTETVQKWILRDSDIDEEWNAYISNLNKLGMDKVLKIMQKAYLRSYKK